MSESLFEKPPVHPFVECPSCRQLVEFGARHCSHCREPIDPDYAVASAGVVHHNTQACSLANAISTLDAFIPLLLIGSIFIFVFDLYGSGGPALFLFLPLFPLIPLIGIVLWFFRFSQFKFGDDEFLKARREVRRSFIFWLVVLVVQVLVIAVWRLRTAAT